MSKVPTNGAYIKEALLIDSEPTSYDTKFRPTALIEVADKINDTGMALLLAHDHGSLPVGSWYEAKVENGAVFTKFFVPAEIKEHDDIKTRVEAGILDSVSIGFYADTHDCSICGNDIQDYESCQHIPGRKYEVKDPVTGDTISEETCYVMLDGIHASEASLVYSGAVEAAKIVDSDDKKEFFAKNNFNFSKGSLNLQTVNSGSITNTTTDTTTTERKEMDDELKQQLYDAKDEILALKEAAIETAQKVVDYDAKVAEYDAKVADYDAKVVEYTTLVKSLGEKVEGLAAPFEVDYEAKDDIHQLLVDLDKYIEKQKALPSGQQTITEDELVYSEPDSAYKV